jgi:hypothetical protein
MSVDLRIARSVKGMLSYEIFIASCTLETLGQLTNLHDKIEDKVHEMSKLQAKKRRRSRIQKTYAKRNDVGNSK